MKRDFCLSGHRRHISTKSNMQDKTRGKKCMCSRTILVYYLVFGCFQITVIGIACTYFPMKNGSPSPINIDKSLPGKPKDGYRSSQNRLRERHSLSHGNTLLYDLDRTDLATSLYFIPETRKTLYVWNKDSFVPTKASVRVKATKLLSREDCQNLNNYTQTNIEFSADKHHDVEYTNLYAFKEELDMPIAYSILVYTDYEMLELLLRTIYKPHNTYCIHVDTKSSMTYKERVVQMTQSFENVFIANKLYSVKWGTFSIVEAEFSCMEELLNKSSSWKYFINLTGQEFPLRTNYEIATVLHTLQGFNNIRCDKNMTSRLQFAGPPPFGLTAFRGSTHAVLTREFVQYMLTDKQARKIIDWSKNVTIPDETVFTTLLCNRKLQAPGTYFAYPSVYDPKKSFIARYKIWRSVKKCHGKIVRNVCIFGSSDLQTLQKRHELFANKFDINEFPTVPYCLRNILLKRTVLEYSGFIDFNATFYNNLS